MFEELAEAVEVLPKRERPHSDWTRLRKWALLDQRSYLRKQGTLTQAEERKLGRCIHAVLDEDRQIRARRAAEATVLRLADGEAREAWSVVQAWHKEVNPAASKQCYDTPENQTTDMEELYTRVVPPGDRMLLNVDRPLRQDHPPTDGELRQAAKKSSNGWTGGASKMQAEDLNKWRWGAENEERARRKGKTDYEGVGDRWHLLAKLCQHIWRMREIPTRMLLAIAVLIPKGTSGNFRGIGLLEVIWKLLERVLDARFSEIELHNYINGFRGKRGCRTGVMEAKLIQQLAFWE